MFNRPWLLVLGCTLCCLTAQAQTYNVTDLGTLGGTLSEAYGLNDSGQIVGYSATSGNAGHRAFLYQNGSMTDLGTLGGSRSEASAINNAGQIVGYSYLGGDTVQRAFLYQN